MPIPLRTIIIMASTAAVVVTAAVIVIPPSTPPSNGSTAAVPSAVIPEAPEQIASAPAAPSTAVPPQQTSLPPPGFPAPPLKTPAPATRAASPAPAIEDERLAQLRNADSTLRLQALDLIWESADSLPDRQTYAEHVAALSQDPDPEVAELATRLTAFLRDEDPATDEIISPSDEFANDESTNFDQMDPAATGDWEEPLPADDAAQEQAFVVPPENESAQSAEPETSEEAQPTQLYDNALNSTDPQVRHDAITQSAGVVTVQAFEVLTQAVQDTDPNNRLAALEGLEQLLQQGVGDAEQIAPLLIQSKNDADERVAELATRMLRGQASSAIDDPEPTQTEP